MARPVVSNRCRACPLSAALKYEASEDVDHQDEARHQKSGGIGKRTQRTDIEETGGRPASFARADFLGGADGGLGQPLQFFGDALVLRGGGELAAAPCMRQQRLHCLADIRHDALFAIARAPIEINSAKAGIFPKRRCGQSGALMQSVSNKKRPPTEAAPSCIIDRAGLSS
jgi:hypothetical protein